MERVEEREVARAVHRALMERGPLCAKAAATDEVPVGRITSGNYALIASALGVPLDALFRPISTARHARKVAKPAA